MGAHPRLLRRDPRLGEHLRRLPGHAAHAGDVPEEKEVTTSMNRSVVVPRDPSSPRLRRAQSHSAEALAKAEGGAPSNRCACDLSSMLPFTGSSAFADDDAAREGATR